MPTSQSPSPPAVAGRRSRRGLGLLAGLLLLGFGKLPVRSPAPAAPAAAGLPAGAYTAHFQEITAETGIRWSHENGAFGQRWLPETLGPGVIVLDANGDGKPDLLFVNGRNFPGHPGRAATPALYLNRGGFRFEDVTRQAGLALNAYCLGGAAADIDNDGFPDVYLSCLGQDHLFHNNHGHFVDVTRQAGLSQAYELGASVAFFDADRDGFVDVFVTRYVDWKPTADRFCSVDGKTKTYCTPQQYPGTSSRYYHNRRNGTFEDWTQKAGLANLEGKALGVVPLDYDGDGWPDLAVSVDTQPNLLYHNKGDGTFAEVGISSGMALTLDGQLRGGMGIDAGDFDHSGRPSLAITNFSYEMTGLYRNQGNGFFVDVAPSGEIGRKTLSYVGWGCLFFDYDLDGWLDLLVANGHLDDAREQAKTAEPYRQPLQLFHNKGGTSFTEVAGAAGGDLARPMVARGAAFADLDGDGDLDLVVTTNGGPARLFENRGTHGNWLRLALQGTASNRDGFGATIRLTARGVTQTWYVHSGGSYLSQSQIEPTFGLGAARVVDEVVISWPSGTVQRLTAIPVNQRLKVVEPPSGPSRSSRAGDRRGEIR